MSANMQRFSLSWRQHLLLLSVSWQLKILTAITAIYMFRRMLKAENCKSMMKMNGYWIRLSFLIG